VGGKVSPPTEQWFDPGAIATATAIPAKCFGFSNWEGDATGTQNPLSIVMNKPKHVVARFFTGDITTRFETNPPGLKLFIDGVEYVTPRTFTWPICSSHTVNAITPQMGPPGYRYLFANWSDRGRAIHTILTPGAVTTFTASFNTQCALTVSVEPATWGRIRPSGLVWLPCGASATLTPRARRGAVFVEWRGDASGSEFPLTITLDRPKNIIAYLNAIPRANFVTSPVNAKLLEPVQFTDQSTDPNGNSDIVSWQWDFGDQTTSTERHPIHIYANAGRYRVCLTVIDRYDSSGTTCKRVKVNLNKPPVAGFIYSPTNPVLNQTVTFDPMTSRDIDGTVAQYAWDFGGDGTFETVYSGYATTTKAFTQIGLNKVCLQVTDNSGAQSLLTCLNVTVSQTVPTKDALSTTNLLISERSKEMIVFEAQSREVERMRVRVLSLNGRELFDSRERPGTTILWTLNDEVPNGIYLYLVSLRRNDGTLVYAMLHKLVLQR
jgi:PKD repeat protein